MRRFEIYCNRNRLIYSFKKIKTKRSSYLIFLNSASKIHSNSSKRLTTETCEGPLVRQWPTRPVREATRSSSSTLPQASTKPSCKWSIWRAPSEPNSTQTPVKLKAFKFQLATKEAHTNNASKKAQISTNRFSLSATASTF